MGKNEMNQYKSIIIITVSVIVAGLIGWLAYYQLAFFSTGTTPKNGAKGPTDAAIRISFNKTPANSIVENFDINPSVPGRVSIDKNDVIFTPKNVLNIDTVYTVKLSNPISQKGQKSGNITFKFTAVYIPFNEQSSKNQNVGISASDSLEKSHPIVQYLPHDDSNYSITYELMPDGKLKLTVTLNAILNRADQLASYKAQLQQYKTEALQYLTSKGAKLSDYVITYSPDPETGN